MAHLGNDHTHTDIYKNLDSSMPWAFGPRENKSQKKLN